MDHEFSRPLAPAGSKRPEETPGQALSNSDFRKIMMTPRAVGSTPSSSFQVPGSVRGFGSKQRVVYETEKVEAPKKKKKYYHHGEGSKKSEDVDTLSDLAKRYRDRAKERRNHNEHDELDMSVRGYQAVAPEHIHMDATELKREEIEKSKFLGGDIEHTHLVKGLDFVLLKKMRSAIQEREDEEEKLRSIQEEMDQEAEFQEEALVAGLDQIPNITFDLSDRYAIKSKFAENLLKVVFDHKIENKNDLFVPGRMAYQYDLVTEFPETEVPVTIIRSKSECPNLDAYSSTTTNAIVIEKLIKIFTNFHASGGKLKKPSRFDILPPVPELPVPVPKPKAVVDEDDNIFDDLDDYVPNITRNKKKDPASTAETTTPVQKHSYFGEKDTKEERKRTTSSSSTGKSALELAAKVVGALGSAGGVPGSEKILQTARRSTKAHHDEELDSYAECYPGAYEHDDAIYDDSDGEDDSKTSKKGAGKKGDSGSTTEPKPKVPKSQNKQLLERDLQKINAILAKKKGRPDDAGSSSGGGGDGGRRASGGGGRHKDSSHSSRRNRI